jgi:hypothetical protein
LRVGPAIFSAAPQQEGQLWPIEAWRHGWRHGHSGPQEPTMSHQPPKENKKKPQHTPKEKKAIKQQKKQASAAPSLIKY